MRRYIQLFRDGKESINYLDIPLAPAEQGNVQTLNVMADIVRQDRIEPDLRIFVLREIIGNVAGHDFEGELAKIFYFAQKKITYRQDPINVERVADIWSTMYALNPKEPEGDCGIKATFFASCCAILGYRTAFVVIKQRPGQHGFNHVYNAVLLNGEWKYYDPTPENQPAGYEARSVEKYLFHIL